MHDSVLAPPEETKVPGPPLSFALDVAPGRWEAARRDGPAAYRKAVDRTIELAQVADRAGIDSLWALEDPDGWDAIAVLSAIARATERIKLGTGVTNPYYRHPSLLAASISTLDALSNGRAFLGLGRGQTEWYQHGLGMRVGNPVRALSETIDLLRQWWRTPSEASSPDDATEFGVRKWKRSITPMQPRVPIYLAAVGPQALRLAGRKADGVLFNDLSSRHFLAAAVKDVKDAAIAAGRDPRTLRFAARAAVTISHDPEAIYEKRKATIAAIHVLPGMERLLTTPGFDTEGIITEVRRLMNTNEILSRGGAFADLRSGGDLEAAKRAIPIDLMRELVIAGPIPVVRARLGELRAIGITDVFLTSQGPNATVESLSKLVDSLR